MVDQLLKTSDSGIDGPVEFYVRANFLEGSRRISPATEIFHGFIFGGLSRSQLTECELPGKFAKASCGIFIPDRVIFDHYFGDLPGGTGRRIEQLGGRRSLGLGFDLSKCATTCFLNESGLNHCKTGTGRGDLEGLVPYGRVCFHACVGALTIRSKIMRL